MSKHEYLLNGETVEAEVQKSSGGYTVTVGDVQVEVTPMAPGLYAVVVDGEKKIAAAATVNGATFVEIDSVVSELVVPGEDGFGSGGGDTDEAKDKIMAPMPGKIVKLLVAVGDKVEIGQQTVIVEAMKMENPVAAKAVGTVIAINYAEGDQVDTDNPIIELELDEE